FTLPEKRNDLQKKTLEDAFLKSDPARAGLLAEIDALTKKEPKVVTSMVVAPRATPRVTNVHLRGEFLQPGAVVEPEAPAVLPPLETTASAGAKPRPNRLHLARWLVSNDHPLTARVTVNRVWQVYFGLGLVETENDFGTQGTPPSHPDLLDWLADDFRSSGWSLKRLHRLILTSGVYRQASHRRRDMETIDPRNRLLARQNRLRLEAEGLRDAALAVGGLLSTKIGGPSVFPYQPDGVMQLAQVNRPWTTSAGGDQYRRTLYTYYWRSTPHPFLKLFDAPDAQRSCTRRTRSNTPLQALTLLNDLAFVECAEALADRLRREGPPGAADDRPRIDYAFRLCLGRSPTERETAALLTLVEQERRAAAPAPTGKEDAAWNAVARVLLNIDEFLTRE
ncbi:MAG: DUF1553 domain-containing protein, partial [Planctomycetia bacterium]